MDIAALSMSMAQNSLQTDVSIAVLGKTLDTEEALGSSLVQVMDAAAMERSVNPDIGANLDVRI